MKTHSYRSRNALVLIVTCLFLSGYTANHAMSYDAQSSRAALAWPVPVRPVNGPARLNINRIPDLGNFVIVRLWIDGMGPDLSGMVTPMRVSYHRDGMS